MSRKDSWVLLLIAALSLSGCTRRVQAWPPPLPIGATVTVRFGAPRVLVLDERNHKDSVVGISQLEGTAVNLSNDTVFVIVTKERSTDVDNSRMLGREVAVPLDRTTIVTRSEIDGWKFAYGLLAGVVLIFAGLVISSD